MRGNNETGNKKTRWDKRRTTGNKTGRRKPQKKTENRTGHRKQEVTGQQTVRGVFVPQQDEQLGAARLSVTLIQDQALCSGLF